MRLVEFTPLGGTDEFALLKLTSAVENDSEHPIARALVSEARARGLVPQRAERVQALPGSGVEGVVLDADGVGRQVLLGNADLMRERGLAVPEEARELSLIHISEPTR